jgi:hypothetical protein
MLGLVFFLSAGFLAGCLVGVVLYESLISLALIAVGVGVFVLMFSMVPERFEVFRDRLSIVLPLYRWDIAYGQIVTVRPERASDLFKQWAPFGSWPAASAVIVTTGSIASKPWPLALIYQGNGVILSARGHAAFLSALQDARARYAAAKATM